MLEIPVGWLLVPLIPVIVGWLLGWLTPVISERITLWIRGPKLQLDFTNTEDCLTITPEEFQVTPSSFEKRDVFFARIRVTNLKPRIATKCQAWLISVEADDGQGNFKPTVFKDSIPLTRLSDFFSRHGVLSIAADGFCFSFRAIRCTTTIN